jgi:hypothetical protein
MNRAARTAELLRRLGDTTPYGAFNVIESCVGTAELAMAEARRYPVGSGPYLSLAALATDELGDAQAVAAKFFGASMTEARAA